MRPKKCAGCGEKFQPVRQFQKACSVECSVLIVVAEKQKAKRVEYRAKKEKSKTRQDWLKTAQISFNAYIRHRDGGLACISCGSATGKRNAGHYRSIGACPELRFEELNCHVQCEKCNSWLSGNAIEYRINLIKKIGIVAVEWLEGKHEPKHYTIDDAKVINAVYKQKLKEALNL